MSEANVLKRKVREYQKLFEQQYCFYSLRDAEKPDTGELRLVHYDEESREEFKQFCLDYEKPIRDKDLNRFKDNSSYWALLTPEGKIASWGWLAYRQPFYIKEMDTQIEMGDAETAILYDFHTDKEYRGRGYYGILLRSIVHESKGPGKYIIYARRNNPASCRGIEKAGFYYEGEYSQAGGQMDEYLLSQGFAAITHPHEPLQPELSVIIPVYNAGKYIQETLDSILKQSLAHLEVLCVDDGSTDDSREIIQAVAEEDPRVRLITQENQFAGIARNNGLLHARGDYVHFMDADDTVLPYGYHCAIAKAKSHDLDVLKFGGIAIEEATGKTREGYAMDGIGFADFMRLLDPEKDDVLFQISVTPWSGIYKRTFLTDHHIEFNGLRICNDRSFYIRCITLAKRIMVSSDKVVLHRVEVPTSLVSSRAK
ncbi:MAG: GNAT family N-acetyltransferase, partial [Erysipelotrichaceae bacterium]|nr:GNAT family N-acetyltransferase [Erysipelotrichaceae bacterium]